MDYTPQIPRVKLFSYLALQQILDAELRPSPARYTVNLVLVEDFFQPGQILILKDMVQLKPGIQDSFRKQWRGLLRHQLIPFLSENLEEPLALVRSNDNSLAEAIATHNQWPGLFGIRDLDREYIKAQLRPKNRSKSEDWLNLDYLKALDEALVLVEDWPEVVPSKEVMPWH